MTKDNAARAGEIVHPPYRAQRINDDTRPYAVIGRCSWGDEIVADYLPKWQARTIALWFNMSQRRIEVPR